MLIQVCLCANSGHEAKTGTMYFLVCISRTTMKMLVNDPWFCSLAGAKSLLAEDYLAPQDLALLAVLEFLCACGSVQPIHSLLFKPQEVRRRLLLLVEPISFSKALHLNMVGSGHGEQSLQVVPRL